MSKKKAVAKRRVTKRAAASTNEPMTDLVRALRDFARDLPTSVPLAIGAETARDALVKAADQLLGEKGVV